MIGNWKLRNELDDHVMDANILQSSQNNINNYCKSRGEDLSFSKKTMKIIKFMYVLLGLVVLYLIYCVSVG